MKLLKIIGLIFAALIVVILIAALFIKKEYNVTREVTINKPKAEVFDYIKHLKNQINYSKWAMMDPNCKMTFSGEDATVGFISAWDSKEKNVGQGEQKISKIVEGERLETTIHFIRPFESNAQASFTTTEISNGQTKVSWSFNTAMPYPFNFMSVFMNMEKMVGDDIQTGLNNLKTLLEK